MRWETKRQLDVLNQRLAVTEDVAGNEYTVADMAIWPWYGLMVKGEAYDAGEFLQVHEDTPMCCAGPSRWASAAPCSAAASVNRVRGDLASRLHERHDASDFETKTQDKSWQPNRRPEAGGPPGLGGSAEFVLCMINGCWHLIIKRQQLFF